MRSTRRPRTPRKPCGRPEPTTDVARRRRTSPWSAPHVAAGHALDARLSARRTGTVRHGRRADLSVGAFVRDELLPVGPERAGAAFRRTGELYRNPCQFPV